MQIKVTKSLLGRKMSEGWRQDVYFCVYRHYDKNGCLCVGLFDFYLYIGMCAYFSRPLSEVVCRFYANLAKGYQCKPLSESLFK